MAIQWLRLWHDMPNDPKWRTISRLSKQPIPCVIAVYLHLLVSASANANERGRTQSVCVEDVASALDMESEQVDAIISSMQGRVIDGDRISGWDKRQVEREDGSAARAKAWREAKKEQERTQANASERKKTPDKDKDKDKDIPPIPPEGNQSKGKSISFPEFLKRCRDAGETPIPDSHPVFAYASEARIPNEFLALHWFEFKDRYADGKKKYTDWRKVFSNSVRGNWFRLWYAPKDGGEYQLTTDGVQAQNVHKDKLK